MRKQGSKIICSTGFKILVSLTCHFVVLWCCQTLLPNWWSWMNTLPFMPKLARTYIATLVSHGQTLTDRYWCEGVKNSESLWVLFNCNWHTHTPCHMTLSYLDAIHLIKAVWRFIIKMREVFKTAYRWQRYILKSEWGESVDQCYTLCIAMVKHRWMRSEVWVECL